MAVGLKVPEAPTDHIANVQISVRVEEAKAAPGMWRATSQLVPGLCVYARTAQEALEQVPAAMADLAKAEHKDDWLAKQPPRCA
jgi:hypothetical protein